MTKHTPGPWTAVIDELVPERGRVYIQAKGFYDPEETIGEAYKTDRDVDNGNLRETEANAQLFADAPDLLAALKAACGYMTNAAIDLETGAPKKTAPATLNGGLALVMAAIAKAERST